MSVITGLSEVILHVENMQEMVEFYRDSVGLRVRHPQGREDFRQEAWVEFETGGCTLCLHSGGRRASRRQDVQIVFEVTDMDEARDELEERGVIVGEPRMAAPGVWVCDGEDCEGNLFSLEHRSNN